MVNWIPGDNLERIERLRAEINGARFQADGAQISVTCSFGVSWAETETIAVEDLLRLADRALYRSKSLGRNRVECELWNQRPHYSATTMG